MDRGWDHVGAEDGREGERERSSRATLVVETAMMGKNYASVISLRFGVLPFPSSELSSRAREFTVGFRASFSDSQRLCFGSKWLVTTRSFTVCEMDGNRLVTKQGHTRIPRISAGHEGSSLLFRCRFDEEAAAIRFRVRYVPRFPIPASRQQQLSCILQIPTRRIRRVKRRIRPFSKIQA